MKDSLQYIACFWLFTVPMSLLGLFLFLPSCFTSICNSSSETAPVKRHICVPPSNVIIGALQMFFLLVELLLSFRVGRRFARHSKETHGIHQFIDIMAADPLVPNKKKI